MSYKLISIKRFSSILIVRIYVVNIFVYKKIINVLHYKIAHRTVILSFVFFLDDMKLKAFCRMYVCLI